MPSSRVSARSPRPIAAPVASPHQRSSRHCGLGSPVAIYLALAGVGTIGIVEFDTVDITNLQRQLLHQTEDIGKSKLQSAIESLHSYNPHVTVVPHNAPMTS